MSELPLQFPCARRLRFSVPRERWTEHSPCRGENNLELTPVAKSSRAPIGEEIADIRCSAAFPCTGSSNGLTAGAPFCHLFAPFPEGCWEVEGTSVVPKGETAGRPDMDPKTGLPRKRASVSFVKSSIFARSSPADLGARGKVAVRVSGEAANRRGKGCLA